MAKKDVKTGKKAAVDKGGAKKSATNKLASKRPTKKQTSGRNSGAVRGATIDLKVAGGPVTLDEARRIAHSGVADAKPPKGARRRQFVVAAGTSHASDSGPSPQPVGEEREKLDAQRRREREERIAEYTATMTVMKQRGVKGLVGEDNGSSAPKRRGPVAAAGAPLQIFAEGDSWFDYPVPLFGGGIVKRLENRLGVPILNLAKAGDEVRFMLGVDERAILKEQLSKGCPAGGPWDVLLFSGGGNDIVGSPMALWVHDFRTNVPAESLIQTERFEAALNLVRAGYEDLIGLRDDLSASTELVFHAYDFAIPDGRGICHMGPWLKPTFTLRRFPANGTVAFAVVKAMLTKFAKLLKSLADAHPNVTFIDAQGTLAQVTASWHNELHPSRAGYNQISDVFHAKLKQLFPLRVL